MLVALDWDTDSDAQQWAEAVRVYVDKAFDADEPGPPELTPCAATACWDLGGHAVAFEQRRRSDGTRRWGSISTPRRSSLEPFSAELECLRAVTRFRDST